MVAIHLNDASMHGQPYDIAAMKKKSSFYSEYVCAFLSSHTLHKLEQQAGDVLAGFVFVRVDDFYGFTAANGEKEGLRLLSHVQSRTEFYFKNVLSDYPFLALDASGINHNLITFLLPENTTSYPEPELLKNFRHRLETDINQSITRNDGSRITLRIGMAAIDLQNERFYKALFKAYCTARQVAHPSSGLPPKTFENRISFPTSGDARPSAFHCGAPIRGLVQQGVTVSPEHTVQDVKKQIEFRNSVVIIRDHIPLGIVMNYHLDRKLSTPYGISLFYHRPVTRLMNSHPLIVDINDPVEDVAKAAMERSESTLYDDVIVCEAGKYVGTVSVQKLMDHLAENQVRIAMGANPLTRLPGNIVIEQVIEARIRGGQPSSLIYIDLDNFKVYNDVYGFENGDKMILFAAQVIQSAADENAGDDVFVGHVGGDDFVVISEQKQAEAIAEAIISAFEKDIGRHYSRPHREKGYIFGKGRDGIERQFPFVSVSIGILDCDFRHPFTMDELSRRVAEVKKYAKSKTGSSYVRDRRSPVGKAQKQKSC